MVTADGGHTDVRVEYMTASGHYNSTSTSGRKLSYAAAPAKTRHERAAGKRSKELL